MTECEWDEDLPGPDGCGTTDVAVEAVTARRIAWTSRIWGGEGEDWDEEIHLCKEHAAAFDAKMAEVDAERKQQAVMPEPEAACELDAWKCPPAPEAGAFEAKSPINGGSCPKCGATVLFGSCVNAYCPSALEAELCPKCGGATEEAAGVSHYCKCPPAPEVERGP